ncbi:hypothetical protein RB195_026546 [Necator americanus]|uniref:Uncharacterized protein n=1 Tax=Necator americanus TaxID=51031 RepID=A0ABR1EWL5_NECAM
MVQTLSPKLTTESERGDSTVKKTVPPTGTKNPAEIKDDGNKEKTTENVEGDIANLALYLLFGLLLLLLICANIVFFTLCLLYKRKKEDEESKRL